MNHAAVTCGGPARRRAAMAGTVDLILGCYAALEIGDGVLRLHPSLPPELPQADFKIVYSGQPISVELNSAR